MTPVAASGADSSTSRAQIDQIRAVPILITPESMTINKADQARP
jgi:hypothetical protein